MMEESEFVEKMRLCGVYMVHACNGIDKVRKIFKNNEDVEVYRDKIIIKKKKGEKFFYIEIFFSNNYPYGSISIVIDIRRGWYCGKGEEIYKKNSKAAKYALRVIQNYL